AHTEGVANFHDAFASIYEGRYLAGVAAGMKLLELYDNDKDGKISDAEAKIGYVGAWPYAEVISGYTSFFLGVKSMVSNVTMTVRYTNSWYDETAEKTTALKLIDEGCKLISQHADSMGAPTACEERGIPNVAYNGATGKSTFVVASRINWVPYFEMAIRAAMNKTAFEGGYDYVGTISSESVLLTDLGPAAAAGTAEKLAEVKAKLLDGSLKVSDVSTFTVTDKAQNPFADFTADEQGHLITCQADVDFDEAYAKDHQVIKTENGITYYAESELRSAPYFDLIIDGITAIVE
ncbi:MAG: BMP family ABC transporter substrate-binding protein, partial [Clostridia bacterium]|nr:BMP family ABC transporter substrate-binding protein [Clostridia bacterium]